MKMSFHPKLSKHLLEMKFMQRSKLKVEKDKLDNERKLLFDFEAAGSLKKSGNQYIIEPSFVPCEDLKFGRMSFRGANPEIEKIMRDIDAAEAETTIDRIEKQGTISEEEMANRYSTLIGTVAKKFSTKKGRCRTDDEPPIKKKKFLKPSDCD